MASPITRAALMNSCSGILFEVPQPFEASRHRGGRSTRTFCKYARNVTPQVSPEHALDVSGRNVQLSGQFSDRKLGFAAAFLNDVQHPFEQGVLIACLPGAEQLAVEKSQQFEQLSA